MLHLHEAHFYSGSRAIQWEGDPVEMTSLENDLRWKIRWCNLWGVECKIVISAEPDTLHSTFMEIVEVAEKMEVEDIVLRVTSEPISFSID